MKKYKNKDGVVLPQYSIVIRKGGQSIMSPSHEELIKHGWEEVPHDNLEDVKKDKKNAIDKIHSSKRVKSIKINNVKYEISTTTLNKMLLRVLSEHALGVTDTILWFGTDSFEMTTEDALQLLYKIQTQWGKNYDNKQKLLKSVENAKDSSEVAGIKPNGGYEDILELLITSKQ